MTQIALPIDARQLPGNVRILTGESNRAVIEALAAPSRWPFHTAVLTGPPRSGKSLLARWFADHGGGEAIDDAHSWEEDVLFHRWNRAQDDGRPLLLVGVPGWDIRLPDLRSRIGGSLHLAILPPDDAMVADLVLAHAEQRRLALPDGAAHYLAPRVERSYAAIERLVAEIDRISLERQVAPTMSVWRDAIEAIVGPAQGRLL